MDRPNIERMMAAAPGAAIDERQAAAFNRLVLPLILWIEDREARVAELEGDKSKSDRMLADAVGLDDANFGSMIARAVLRDVAKNLGLGATGWTYIELDKRLKRARPGWATSVGLDQRGEGTSIGQVWEAVLDEHTLEVCALAYGTTTHGPVSDEYRHRCRCFRVQRGEVQRGEGESGA